MHVTKHYLCPCSVNIRTNNHYVCTENQLENQTRPQDNEQLRKTNYYTYSNNELAQEPPCRPETCPTLNTQSRQQM